jgi:hypothetical protein
MTMSQRELKEAYSQFLQAVMRLLYDHDPDGIGRSIDAPLDEYRELATRLLPSLSRAETSSKAAAEVRKLVPTAEQSLITALWSAQLQYKAIEAS